MGFGNRGTTLFWLVVFTFAVVRVSWAAPLDPQTVVFAYLFDEGRGNVATDISGNGRDGDISGAKYVEGVFGTCLDYDGKDDNLVVTGYTGISGTEPRTTVFWFKAGDVREHSWVKWGLNATGTKYYVRAHLRGGDCNLRVEVSGGQNYGADNVCDEEWHHMAVVFPEGSEAVKDHDLYVDGELQSKEGTDQVMDTDGEGQEVNMGDFLLHHEFMFGLFDEVALFNVALTENEINIIRESGLQAALGVEPDGKLATRWAMLKRY